MTRKQLSSLIVIVTLLTLASVIAAARFTDLRLGELLNGIFVLTMYLLLIILYLLRLALPVFGVFAVYKMFRQRAISKRS